MRYLPSTVALLAAAAVALSAGCGPKQASGAISRDRFVQANVDLRSVPDTVARGDSLRRVALRKHRVTEADLRRFLEVHGRDPEYLASVWREVSDSLQRRFERTFPSVQERTRQVSGATPTPPGAEPSGIPVVTVPPAVARGVGRPPPPPNQPPPPVTEAPRDMARPGPPVRRPPPGGVPPDARGPTTAPVRPPVVQPRDTLD